MKKWLLAFLCAIPIICVGKGLDCLAYNIYYESRGEPLKGQVAVAAVTLNRVRDKKFPPDICKVVYQKTGGICQFSWVCQKKRKIQDIQALVSSYLTAHDVIRGLEKDPTNGALYFHSTSVNPKWDLKHSVTIGNHKFYTQK